MLLVVFERVIVRESGTWGQNELCVSQRVTDREYIASR